MEYIGYWWNDSSIKLVKIGDDVFALSGWNGEKWLECWRCLGEFLTDSSHENYTLTPVYRFEAEGIDLEQTEEDSDEWEHAMEIVDFEVNKN